MSRKAEKFNVWSTHETGDVLETTRTSEAAAHEDVQLIRDILDRNAWVQEVK